MLALRAAFFALLLLFISRTYADPDLWGHVKFGGDIAASGLHTGDPYSFASDRPWINHEWLAELLLFEAWSRGGNAGLIAAKCVLTLLVLWFVADAVRRVPMSLTLRTLLLFTAAAGLWARIYVVRPQIFSFVLFAAMLHVFKTADEGRRRAVWVLPIIFALWVNLHGGWIVGLGTLAVWTVCQFAPFQSAKIPRLQLLAVLAISALATLLNPYGLGMWTFIAETVRFERSTIADWQPLVSAGPGKIVAWGTAAVLAGAALVHRRPPVPLAYFLIVAGFAAASLKVSRLDAFFSISAVVLLAPQIAAFVEGRRKLEQPAAAAVRGRWMWAAALVLGTLLAVAIAPRQFQCIRLDGPWMPEREAAAAILENRLEGRLLVWFDWGQYAIWHFAPALRVSLDGRRETVYSGAYLAKHTSLYFEPRTQKDFLAKLDADHAWLAAALPLVSALENRGWTRVFEGPESVVLSRRLDRFAPVGAVRTAACFPGP